MKLKDCLEERGYWELRLMASQLQVRLSGKHPAKVKVVEALLVFLHEPKNIASLLRRLGEGERAALDALIAAGGSLPWAGFGERFGEIRLFRPWRADSSGQSAWAAQSSAEMLAYLGLIFRTPRRPTAGQEVKVLIAHDLLPLLPMPKPFAKVNVVLPQAIGQASEGALRHDITLLLSFVHREQVKARYKGRWFSQKDLERLNGRLMVREDLTMVRSELQSGRIRFLHFLAESAGLIGALNGYFVLTPLAWQWLEATREVQDERLWQAWQAETSEQTERWKRYRLVGSEQDAPLTLLAGALAHLARQTVLQPLNLEGFKESLQAQEAKWWQLTTWWEEEEGRNRTDEFIRRLFSEMLSWWEVVLVEGEGFTLTAKGAWLLGAGAGERHSTSLDDKEVREEEEKRGFEIADTTLPEQLRVDISPKSSAQVLVRLEALAEWVGRADDEMSYQLTPKSLAKALERGSQFKEILAFLDTFGGGLTGAQVDKLTRWSEKIVDVRLHHATLLETRTSEQMSEITRLRQVRQNILRTLNPRTVVVNEAKIAQVTRYLRRQGISLIAPSAEGSPKNRSNSAQGAASLLICARVYQALGQWLDLPQPLPTAMLEELAAQLDSATQSAAQQASEQTIERLKQVIDGYAPRLDFTMNGLPEEQTVPTIQQALREDDDLDLTYWSAGRGVQTKRCVQPYRLEFKGKIGYLYAYCYQARDERCFRIDRIKEIKIEPRGFAR